MKFRPSGPQDIRDLQQIIQGTSLSSMSFKIADGYVIYLAEDHGNIVGIATGHVQNEDVGVVLTLHDFYLRASWNTLEHENELRVHMIEWAQQHRKMGKATHYRSNIYQPALPICITHFIPETLQAPEHTPLPQPAFV